jgi:hypothetical protein
VSTAGLIDILMVTYNRAGYTRRALSRLLETCDDHMRVWVWHNGNDAATLAVIRALEGHPRMHRIHHSPENKRLREPTNWFWRESSGELLSKVDDDNLMPDGWGARMRDLHASDPHIGVAACWSFMPEDVVPELVERKLRRSNGHAMMVNCWVAGTGHVMKRACYTHLGPMLEGQSFTNYCVRLAAHGWVNGYAYPFLYMENFDDPRHPDTQLKTEADFRAHRGLSARKFGVRSLEELKARQNVLAMQVLRASPDVRDHVGWRPRLRRAVRRVGQWVRPGATPAHAG